VGYTLSLLLSGRLVDRLGVRLGMGLFVTCWSLANMLTGVARSLASLAAFRFLLGLGEAGNWPGSAKAVSECFPVRERAAAIGLYTMGATIGATVAPLLILGLKDRFGWQGAFVATGILGLGWVLPWILVCPRRPATTVEPSAGASAEQPPTEWQRWRSVLTRRDVWLLAVGRLLTDPVWYFYQFWLATYLQQARGMTESQAGVQWVVFLAADVGSLGGGLLSGWLIRRGTKAPASRLWVMLAAACLVPLSPLIPRLESPAAYLAVAMVVVFAHLCWLVNISSLLVDVIPGPLLGTAFGLAAAASAAGGIAMNALVARCAQQQRYDLWFAAMALLHPAAWLLVRFGGVVPRSMGKG